MAISSVSSSSAAAATGDGTRIFVSPPAAPSPEIPAPTTGGSAQAPSPEHVAQAVKQVNDAFTQKGQNLHASIERDQASGINVVKVQDTNTKEVISQYPSKAIVAMAEAFNQSQEAKGRLINVRA